MVALDTGFFVAMIRGSEEARSIWRGIRDSRIRPVISTLAVGELLYILYSENRKRESEGIVKKIMAVAEVIPVDMSVVLKGVEIKHSQEIPYVDSLIGATAMLSNCKVLYTSDRAHMKTLEDYGLKVVIVRE